MKRWLRLGGLALIAAGVILAAAAFLSAPKAPEGEFTHSLTLKDKILSGAYKSYGVRGASGAPMSLWAAKTVFRNGTNERVTNLRVRYRVTEYADWCSWHTYGAVDPSQTVVDLYHPIFSSICARLTSRAPAELQLEYEYTDFLGQKHQQAENRPLTMFSRHEFIFSDLTSGERTSMFQDDVTYSPLLAAWVSRSDDPIARIASMANKRAGGVGAGSSDENCVKVMAAIYDVMRMIHISYQHPAALVDKGLSYDIKTVQSLQYPRDTIQKRSGTCIDLAILYAAMLNSVSIDPFLVVIDGHCFPMARLPSGKLIPVEATGVGDGYEKAMDFEQAVKSAVKTWKEVNQSGRYVLVNVQHSWMDGIANPELETLPPDVLEKWGIVALIESPNTGGPQVAARTPGQAGAPPNVNLSGRWVYALNTSDGRTVKGLFDISAKGGQLQMIASSSYQMMGQDGRMHQVSERNNFIGVLSGQNLSAQCHSATYTMDGQPFPPQGLPLQLSLVLSPDGRTMQGQVANSYGMNVPIYAQRQ
jgi:hypothetical protein